MAETLEEEFDAAYKQLMPNSTVKLGAAITRLLEGDLAKYNLEQLDKIVEIAMQYIDQEQRKD